MTDYADLKAAATYAAQDVIKFSDESEEIRALQQFHEEVDPETVLALIAENERLQGCEEVLRQLASYCGCGGYNAPEVDPEVFAKKIMDGINILNDPLVALADKRAAERDELKLEVAGLKTGYEAYEQVNAELKAENEALRANSSLSVLLPELDSALEDLELHGQHSDQGYRKLKDWYRKVDLACKAIDAAMSKAVQP